MKMRMSDNAWRTATLICGVIAALEVLANAWVICWLAAH